MHNENCSICHGTGLISYDVPVDDPRFGKLYPCPEIPRIDLPAFSVTGLVPGDLERSWDYIYPAGNIMEAVQKVRATLDRGYGWVYIYGRYGIAKTTLLKIATAEWFNRHGSGCRYVNMADMMDDLRSSYDEEKGQTEIVNRMDKWEAYHLLALDEMDKGNITPFVEERRFAILNKRYERALYKDSITLMASNSPPETLGSYLFSRIRDNRFEIVQLNGDDVRASLDWTDI